MDTLSRDGRVPRVRHSSSTYDFVKVRVWLGSEHAAADECHATVLSRFLLCRTLTACKVPYDAAVKISLEVKKQLVDSDQLDVSQAALETALFRVMRKRAFADDYVQRYRMLTAFHLKRAPLIILLAGGLCSGKSTAASQLSQRLNLPNVVQTDMVLEILRSSESPKFADLAACSTNDAATALYETQCAAVCKGFEGMLRKCLAEGKSLVVEGLHCHLGMFVSAIERMLAELGGGCKQPVVVPFALRMSTDDRKVLVEEWSTRRCSEPRALSAEQAAAAAESVAAIDAALLAAGAFDGAFDVRVRLAHMSDALSTMHDFVLSRVTESISG